MNENNEKVREAAKRLLDYIQSIKAASKTPGLSPVCSDEDIETVAAFVLKRA